MKMNSQDVKNAISGVLVVDKPVGMTSHDVVQAIRNGTGLRRAGPGFPGHGSRLTPADRSSAPRGEPVGNRRMAA